MNNPASKKSAESDILKQWRKSDHRYTPRWEVDHRVLYKKDQSPSYQECRSRDIGCDGASLLMDESFEPDQKLTLVVFLNQNFGVFVKGKTLWSKPAEGKFLVGVRYEEVPNDVQETILNYAFNLNKSSMKKNWFEGWNNL